MAWQCVLGGALGEQMTEDFETRAESAFGRGIPSVAIGTGTGPAGWPILTRL